MITDLPTEEDFIASSDQFFNLAWDRLSELSEYVRDTNLGDDDPLADEYWTAAQHKLSNALILLQQGAEFALKGRICSVSPYLLIRSDSGDFPSKSQEVDLPFSEFKTIDAASLIEVHDTFYKDRLPVSFRSHFSEVRKLRNSLMHTVDKRVVLVEKDVYRKLLESYALLHGEGRWISCRSEYIDNSEKAITADGKLMRTDLFLEIRYVSEFLSDSEWKRYFGISKKARRYICPSCESYTYELIMDDHPNFAFLNPNTPDSTNLSCLLCDEQIDVIRSSCDQAGCPSNVLWAEDDTCLLCYGQGPKEDGS